MIHIPVHCSSPYTITIANGILNDDFCISALRADHKTNVIISDENVGELYANAFAKKLGAPLFTFPAGESHKTRQTKLQLEDQLLAAGFGRDTRIIAIGGGVVTDLAGFIAATYCRGVDCVYIPTTLLAMVDAAVGGKNGVNTPSGKNLIGTFKQPCAVYIDPTVLRTLGEPEMIDGLVESIKHGLITSASLVSTIMQHSRSLIEGQYHSYPQLIAQSINIKANIITQDEHESGQRAILNLGHTIGHALEQVFHYQISHGQAVLTGLLIEGKIAHSLHILSSTTLQHLYQIYLRFLLTPIKLNASHFHAVTTALKVDKKSLSGVPHMVLLQEIGQVYQLEGRLTHAINSTVIQQALTWFSCEDNLCLLRS